MIIAATVGNALEWFDFGAYTMFAVIIAKKFFPLDSEVASLLATFTAFAIGFLLRPVGAVAIGVYADKSGRKAALSLTILLMAAGTGLIAITPGYATIGLAAPILLVVARMLQGLSAGGDIGSAMAMLIEFAPKEQRARFASWQQVSQAASFLLAGVVGWQGCSVLNGRIGILGRR